jgi:hypothetical protein
MSLGELQDRSQVMVTRAVTRGTRLPYRVPPLSAAALLRVGAVGGADESAPNYRHKRTVHDRVIWNLNCATALRLFHNYYTRVGHSLSQFHSSGQTTLQLCS